MPWAWLRTSNDDSGEFVDLESGEAIAWWRGSSSIMGGARVAAPLTDAAESGIRPVQVPAVCWSGSLAEIDDAEPVEPSSDPRAVVQSPEPSPLASLWQSHPLTWSARGWTELERRIQAEHKPLVLRTHARHVVSDLPGVTRLLKIATELPRACNKSERHLPRLQVLIDPASMLTGSMLAGGARQALDHVRRTLEWCAEHGTHPAVWGVVVSNVRTRADVPDLCEPCGWSDDDADERSGFEPRFEPGLLAALFREHLPAATRRVLIGPDPERQRRFLHAAEELSH